VPYRSIEDTATLRRLLEATLLLEADLDLEIVLHHVIAEARSITGAKYGALGVLSEDKSSFEEFLTVGLTEDEEDAIGARPKGKGVLGSLITDPKPLRLANIGEHPESFGFPPNHPPMKSFLGVPIKVRDEVYGNLYLTDKIGWQEFTGSDLAVVETLAVAAGIAIENSRLHQHVQDAAVFEDRDRLARDLHDTVIQRLFAVGLSLQSIAAASTPIISDRLSGAVSDLDETIRQIRSSIFELGITEQTSGARSSLLSVVRSLEPVLGFEVKVSFEGPVDSAISVDLTEHLLAVLREAITNIGKHAKATTAEVKLSVNSSDCTLTIRDNGKGMPGSTERHGTGYGLGLGNLVRRADKLKGKFTIGDATPNGTLLTWQVPLVQ
jgi:signal transduction histidine kinase